MFRDIARTVFNSNNSYQCYYAAKPENVYKNILTVVDVLSINSCHSPND